MTGAGPGCHVATVADLRLFLKTMPADALVEVASGDGLYRIVGMNLTHDMSQKRDVVTVLLDDEEEDA